MKKMKGILSLLFVLVFMFQLAVPMAPMASAEEDTSHKVTVRFVGPIWDNEANMNILTELGEGNKDKFVEGCEFSCNTFSTLNELKADGLTIELKECYVTSDKL